MPSLSGGSSYTTLIRTAFSISRTPQTSPPASLGKPCRTSMWRIGALGLSRSGQASQSGGGSSPVTSTVPSGKSRRQLLVMGPLHGLGHRATLRSSLIPIRGLLKGIKYRLLCLGVGGQGVNQHRFYLLPLDS